jgi:hypothetical protein
MRDSGVYRLLCSQSRYTVSTPCHNVQSTVARWMGSECTVDIAGKEPWRNAESLGNLLQHPALPYAGMKRRAQVPTSLFLLYTMSLIVKQRTSLSSLSSVLRQRVSIQHVRYLTGRTSIYTKSSSQRPLYLTQVTRIFLDTEADFVALPWLTAAPNHGVETKRLRFCTRGCRRIHSSQPLQGHDNQEALKQDCLVLGIRYTVRPRCRQGGILRSLQLTSVVLMTALLGT